MQNILVGVRGTSISGSKAAELTYEEHDFLMNDRSFHSLPALRKDLLLQRLGSEV